MFAGPRQLKLAMAVLVASVALCVAEPTYIELKPFVNMALQDDGVADNGKGGWSDEGINDFFVYPPLEFGERVFNGFPFRLVKPAGPLAPAVMALKGASRCQDKPLRVEVPANGASGAYVYFLMNAVGSVRIPQNETPLGFTVSVAYADGSTTTIPMRQRREFAQWWTGDDQRPLRTQVYTGLNAYTLRSGNQVSIWATRWPNPHPAKPIQTLTFESEGGTAPVIWAVTVSDEDYTGQARELAPVRDCPPRYFAAKSDDQRQALFDIMVANDHVKGVRGLQAVRADLLNLTIDPAITKTGMERIGPAELYQKPEFFGITSATDPAYATVKHPEEVGRRSYETWNGSYPGFPALSFFWHNFYLRLPEPMKEGHTYTVEVLEDAVAEPFVRRADIAFGPDSVTHAIKLNQAGYAPTPTERYAYLGYWAGDLGTVDYKNLKTFRVIAADGTVAHEGAIDLRRRGDVQSGEDVYEMAISALAPGAYHVYVPGLGRSETFHVGGDATRELYYHTMRAFFHQRCGQELKEPWTFARKPACHLECWESGYLVGERGYTPKPGEKKRTFVGGYHDAADYDHFTYHLPSTVEQIHIFELFPEVFKDGDLNLPESGNGIPDILDEAEWGVRFYFEYQNEDGSVPLGRGNACDAFRQMLPKTHKGPIPRPPFGVLPPKRGSSFAYAASAAAFSGQIRRFDEAKADAYLDSARRAYASGEAYLEKASFGKTLSEQRDERDWKHNYAWAAIELYCATGDERYHGDIKRLNRQRQYQGFGPNHEFLNIWPYLRTQRPVDEALRAQFRERLLAKADELVENSRGVAYRLSCKPDASGGAWGSLNAGHFVDTLLRAHMLTGEAKYLNAAAANGDFQLGCNGLGRSFITSMGHNPPRMPEISGFLYRGVVPTSKIGVDHGVPHVAQDHDTVKGIPIYGFVGNMNAYYPREYPLFYRHRDLWSAASSSEFTITQCVGPTAMLHAYLYALASPEAERGEGPAAGGKQ